MEGAQSTEMVFNNEETWDIASAIPENPSTLPEDLGIGNMTLSESSKSNLSLNHLPSPGVRADPLISGMEIERELQEIRPPTVLFPANEEVRSLICALSPLFLKLLIARLFSIATTDKL